MSAAVAATAGCGLENAFNWRITVYQGRARLPSQRGAPQFPAISLKYRPSFKRSVRHTSNNHLTILESVLVCNFVDFRLPHGRGLFGSLMVAVSLLVAHLGGVSMSAEPMQQRQQQFVIPLRTWWAHPSVPQLPQLMRPQARPQPVAATLAGAAHAREPPAATRCGRLIRPPRR